MIDKILNLIKKFIPKKLFKTLQPAYHFLFGYLAAVWYGHPSNEMIVVGVTGTTGKTTSIFLAADMLKSAGYKVGYISTAMLGDGEKEWLNDKKMTMLGRFFTQKMLSRMKNNNCDVVVIETTSEGIAQFRHRFINYDTLLFTGLYPEHIESHGDFETYKKTKGKLFAHLKRCKSKNIKGKKIEKIIIVNADDEYADYFMNFWADKKITFGISDNAKTTKATNINSDEKGISFSINNLEIEMQLLGKFNVANALAAVCVGASLDLSLEKIKTGLEKIKGVPGRLERINEDQAFTVIVDYAFEPNAVTKLYETVKSVPHNKVIHVLGSTGGGRDRSRRPKLGKLAGENADYIIVTNEDPYDEDPAQIINDIESGVTNHELGKDFWKILDRRKAIKKALSLAQEKDIVLVTGKGSEQAMCVANGNKIPWDDRKIIREILQEL
ncbi:UDP-N-acetylmuramoyl-L-alanyl-D-glutamate--2, 6-diaminopimelate ligase [bacterium BMS3Abin15]|nr:UDP-N-acetylmuramoyl-L-alanyl-D-glutamate--2, 6-diaminopimelate ligase [bacterium BMS3Abin15]HDZ85126.1 UDP-N-acetylmuramyl-tripeptide synthetase [Candidatus Moranbacteria bacterium]